jgi:hypothetical protein
VSARNGKTPAEPDTVAAHVEAAERFAGAIVATFEVCERAGVPLSQMQKTALVEVALLGFDGFGASVTAHARIAKLLR